MYKTIHLLLAVCGVCRKQNGLADPAFAKAQGLKAGDHQDHWCGRCLKDTSHRLELGAHAVPMPCP